MVGGKPATVASLYSGHELEEGGSKVTRCGGHLLVGKAALTPLPTIEEKLRRTVLQTLPPRGKEQVHDCISSMFLLQWDQLVATCEGPTRVMSGQRSQLTTARNCVKTESLNWEPTGGCQGRDDLTKSPVETSKGLLWRTLSRILRGDD